MKWKTSESVCTFVIDGTFPTIRRLLLQHQPDQNVLLPRRILGDTDEGGAQSHMVYPLINDGASQKHEVREGMKQERHGASRCLIKIIYLPFSALADLLCAFSEVGGEDDSHFDYV